MYDLQVETSDMDFTLVYQALPEALPLGNLAGMEAPAKPSSKKNADMAANELSGSAPPAILEVCLLSTWGLPKRSQTPPVLHWGGYQRERGGFVLGMCGTQLAN